MSSFTIIIKIFLAGLFTNILIAKVKTLSISLDKQYNNGLTSYNQYKHLSNQIISTKTLEQKKLAAKKKYIDKTMQQKATNFEKRTSYQVRAQRIKFYRYRYLLLTKSIHEKENVINDVAQKLQDEHLNDIIKRLFNNN